MRSPFTRLICERPSLSDSASEAGRVHFRSILMAAFPAIASLLSLGLTIGPVAIGNGTIDIFGMTGTVGTIGTAAVGGMLADAFDRGS